MTSKKDLKAFSVSVIKNNERKVPVKIDFCVGSKFH